MKNKTLMEKLAKRDPEGDVEICFLDTDDYWSVYRVTGFRNPDGTDQAASVIIIDAEKVK